MEPEDSQPRQSKNAQKRRLRASVPIEERNRTAAEVRWFWFPFRVNTSAIVPNEESA